MDSLGFVEFHVWLDKWTAFFIFFCNFWLDKWTASSQAVHLSNQKCTFAKKLSTYPTKKCTYAKKLSTYPTKKCTYAEKLSTYPTKKCTVAKKPSTYPTKKCTFAKSCPLIQPRSVILKIVTKADQLFNQKNAVSVKSHPLSQNWDFWSDSLIF